MVVSANSLCEALRSGNGSEKVVLRGITGVHMGLELDVCAAQCSLVKQKLTEASLHFICTIWELKAIKVSCVSRIAAVV